MDENADRLSMSIYIHIYISSIIEICRHNLGDAIPVWI
jgi:hypothetical protein